MVHRVALRSFSMLLPLLLLGLLAAMLLQPRTFTVTSEMTTRRPVPQAQLMQQVAPGEFRLPVLLRPVSEGRRLQFLELLFTTSRYSLRLAEASLTFKDSSCRLEADPKWLNNRGPLHFYPQGDTCADLTADPAVAPLAGELRVTLEERGSLAIMSTADPAGGGALQTGEGLAAMGLWHWRPDNATGTRLALLAAMWDAREGGEGGWILGFLAAAAGLTSLGLLLAGRRPALACGLCALSLAVAYAVIAPPYQAPDEPDHFLSFIRQTDSHLLQADAPHLAQLGHFERIKHNPFERFGPWDIGSPYPLPWVELDEFQMEQVGDSRMETRSVLTTRLWEWLSPLVSKNSAARAVLGIRLANALCFGGVAWLSAGLLFRYAGRRARPWFLFLVPALPFFAMHISNYAQFAGASVLLACAGLAILLREEGGCQLPLGIWLGAAASLLVLSASTGVVAAVFVLAMAVAGAPGRAGQTGAARRFWAGLALGSLLLCLGIGSDQMGQMLRVAGRVLGLTEAAPWWSLPVAALAACSAGLGLELLAWRLRELLPDAARLGRLGAGVFAALLAVSCIYSGFQHFGMAPAMPPPGVVGVFWRDILRNLPMLLTFREPDILFSQTFWAGFGWHDVMLPPELVRGLAGLAGLGVVFLGWRAARRPGDLLGWRACCWLLGSWGVFVATGIAAAAADAERGLPNVHGRYLLAGYCMLLAGAFAGWSTTFGRGRRLQAVDPFSAPGTRLLEGWLLAGFWLTLVLAVTRSSLPREFIWLPVQGIHMAIAVGFPVLGWWWRGQGLRPEGRAEVLSWSALLVGAALFGGLVVLAALCCKLPRVFERLPYGLHSILLSFGLVWLAGSLRAVRLGWQAPSAGQAWPAWVVCAGAHGLHASALAFLLLRYMG